MNKSPVLAGKWHLNYPVSVVAELTEDQAGSLLFGYKNGSPYDSWIGYDVMPLKVAIDYPLRKNVTFVVKPQELMVGGRKEKFLSCGEFLWAVAQKYREIYKDPKKYEVWGHDISDLVFESVRVMQNGNVELGIGS